MKTFKGISINSGSILSAACIYSAENHNVVTEYKLGSREQIDKELIRLEEAIKGSTEDLENIVANVAEQMGKTEAEIFVVQKNIINDHIIVDKIKNHIVKERINAESAIFTIFNEYEENFSKLDNEYLKERASDIGEIRRRLLDYLKDTKAGFICEGQKHCSRGMNRVIVAEELTVNMIAHMNFQKVRGFVTERGGIASHAAIIARSLGVPAVSGIKHVMNHIKCGTIVLIDGDNSKVYIDPDRETIAEVISAEETEDVDICSLETPSGVELLANASLLEDIKTARSVGVDGIGLFRTEILFMTAGRLLSEEEQFEYYLKIMNQMGGKPVTFRLLDVGGDKTIPFLGIESEANPYLGWRGARFLLGNPKILSTQIRALARLSKTGHIKILYPMIVDAEQLEELDKFVKMSLLTVDSNPENIQTGAMFEVPSACLQAERIMSMTDFTSIGSNDLIQYLFAVDRNNDRVSQYYDPHHPVLWDLLKTLAETANRLHKPLSICGEMASHKDMAVKLIETGIKSLSISPRLVPRVRNEIARANTLPA